MAITISGENNNDRILASDGVIDQISGFNIVGVITATTFTGNLTGNVTGNLTGNVNSTSPLLLQTGGSERFRITGNNELGIAGANYGSSGQVLTSGGSGSAVTWSAIPTQITFNNATADRVLTSNGGTAVNAEANLTMTGNVLQFNTTANTHGMRFVAAGNHYNTLSFDSNITSAGDTLSILDFKWDGDTIADIRAVAGSDATNKDDGHLSLRTSPSQGGIAERLRIQSGGNVVIGGNYTSTNLGKLHVDGVIGIDDEGSGTSTLNIMTAANTRFKLMATSSLAQILTQNDVYFAIKTDAGTGSGTERLRIDTSGQMGLGVVPNSNWPSNNDFKALQIGTGFCVFGRGSGDEDRGGIAANWYSDGSNQKYIGNGNAARIYLADGNMYFSNAANNTSGANAAMTLEDRVIIDTTGNIQIRGTNHATMYYRDAGDRYGSIFYDGSNFVTRMPTADNYQVELIDGTVHTRFINKNGQSGSGSMLELYGGDDTFMYVRGGTETKPSIFLGGGDNGVDNSRIGARYNLALACNEDGNQTGRKIIFYDDDIELARITEDNQGSSNAQGCMQTTGPGAIRDYYDMRNINLEGNTFDYVSNDSDGGGTSWEIKNGSVIRLYSTSGGHGGKWMRPVYIRQNGYYYWRCNVRLTTTCGSIHGSTSTNHYQYPIMFRFTMHSSGAGSNCKVELNQHYATSGTCNGNQTGTGSLADGTYVTRTGDAIYLTAGTYQPRYFTNGYLGVRELHIYELALIQCGASNSGA